MSNKKLIAKIKEMHDDGSTAYALEGAGKGESLATALEGLQESVETAIEDVRVKDAVEEVMKTIGEASFPLVSILTRKCTS